MQPGRLLRQLFSREIITYILAGILTTLVNLAVFTLLTYLFGPDRWWLSNLPAILAAILFAFLANRYFVFISKGPFWQELARFFLARIGVSLLFEYGFMFLLYNIIGLKAELSILQLHLSISKLLTQLLVLVGNYIISKWFVFVQPERDKE